MAQSKSDLGTMGILARFEDSQALYDAAKAVRDSGYKKWDVYAPLPIHGMDGAMGLKRSKVPCFTLIGGAAGLCLGYLMIWFMNAYDYPLIVGGKPYFSPVFPFPVVYEATILLAAFGTLAGMFVTNKLPRHNHPLFESEQFKAASDDGLFIFLDRRDKQFEHKKAEAFLKSLGGENIEVIKE